jgi:hypothetical protein
MARLRPTIMSVLRRQFGVATAGPSGCAVEPISCTRSASSASGPGVCDSQQVGLVSRGGSAPPITSSGTPAGRAASAATSSGGGGAAAAASR